MMMDECMLFFINVFLWPYDEDAVLPKHMGGYATHTKGH